MKEISEHNPFSVRLVTADYYLSKPIAELDVTFSEFRGSEVKQLPILRVFGATPEGSKTCLHIHGVFPYLYIPCEDSNPEPKVAYQVANSIDKALNISLKQANSTHQHVYKVILVRGIPFYGFHTKVHQFYKIFFYNPSFIKRVADLLQNGAILGLSYQPHEAHINFTMQFFLDFNLYGMSFINLEYIKYRRKSNSNIASHSSSNEELCLPESVEFTSCCEYEVDCLAQHILNRRDVIHGNLGANPGLEALWEDEKQRLARLDMSSTLGLTPSQVRENIPPTDSHLYHEKKLLVKLAMYSEMQNDSHDTNMTLSILNDTPTEQSSIGIDLGESKVKSTSFTSKAVYPAETPDDSNALNATNVVLHHPSYFIKTSNTFNDSVVDESVVLQLTQSQHLSQVNLDSEDMDLMVMLKDMEQNIEDDSILGTQPKDNVEEDDAEEDSCNFNELFTDKDAVESSIKSRETDASLEWNDSFWDNVQNISQLDGAWDSDDDQLNAHKTKTKCKLKVGLSKPKKISAQQKEKNSSILENKWQSPKRTNNINKKIEEFKAELLSPIINPKISPKKRSINFNPLNITLKNSPSKNIILKDIGFSQKSLSDSFLKGNEFDKEKLNSVDLANKLPEENDINTLNPDYRCEHSTQKNVLVSSKTEDQIQPKEKACEKGLTSSGYDRQQNYFPDPGSSKIIKKSGNEKSVESVSDQLNSSIDDSQNDLGIISFYDTTLYQDGSFIDKEYTHHSPINETKINLDIENNKKENDDSYSVKLYYEESSQECKSLNNAIVSKKNHSEAEMKSYRRIVLVPKLKPPSYKDVMISMPKYSIPLCIHETPFYSKFKDVGNQIEVGQIILKVKSKNVSDLKPFQSDVVNNDSIETWRESVFLANNITSDDLSIKDLPRILASNRSCILTPVTLPPSANWVRDWLKAQKILSQKTGMEQPEVAKEKLLMYFPTSPGQEMNNSQMEILSLSSCSPVSLITSPEHMDSTPPVVSLEDKIISIKSTNGKRKSLSQPARRLRPRTLRLSLSRKLSIDSECTLRECKELSQSSSESDITCGQKPEAYHSPTMEHGGNISLDLNKSIICEEPRLDNLKKCVSPTAEKSINLTTPGFKFSGENYQDAPTIHENEYLTVLVLEVLTSTRGDMYPDPAIDPILALFYCITNDCPSDHILPQKESGIIVSKEDQFKPQYNETSFSYLGGIDKNSKIVFVDGEKKLFEEVLNLIAKWDPDILCGYEIEMLSWGYLFQRGFILDLNMASKISRVPLDEKGEWKKSSQEIKRDIKLIGRITLDVWRLLRHEIALTSYTFENIMYHIMHERVPQFSFKTLYFWWSHPSGLLKSLTMEYYLTRVTGIVLILQQLDLVGRTSELARLFGIQWYEVMSRGSQFRVESMMIRMTRPRNYVLVSPNLQQRAAMKAPECLPLIMEPESRFYSDPLIVLDFQSLYPSMMIAYNYCYSTCLGKVKNMGRDAPIEFGCTQLKVPRRLLERLHKKNLINWSPCGVGFVKPAVRKGVLPIMLQDILNTRLMVKKAMKKHKKNKTLQKILHSRQLGLKLIANVTYGYTAANFSGRMPCIEVGDSVVAKGRETLDRAIKLVENTPRWNAKVVYGDTDSLFVLIPGRSKDDAFDIGAEIADAVTNDNPTPVKLKLEKIFHPCILQTKKRYVGYMYETKDQITPEYCAKGIETVRRDGCPIAAKMLEKTLRILFETFDVSKVKTYICKEFQKIIEGKCNIRDFIFAKEFRGLHNYKPGASIPALEIAKQFKVQDHRKEPRDGERLPYVIVCGAPGEALLRLARPPRDLLQDSSLRLNSLYYITRAIIPPLNRCLTLLGVDVNLWFAEMPRKVVQYYPILDEQGNETEGKKSTISQYFSKVNCAGCDVQTTGGLCQDCINVPQKTMLILQSKINTWQRRYNLINKICQSCCSRSRNTECISVDCPVLFRLTSARQDAEQIPFIKKMLQKLLEF